MALGKLAYNVIKSDEEFSTMQPFFMPVGTAETDARSDTVNPLCTELAAKYNLPDVWVRMFRNLSSMTEVIADKQYTFFSLRQISELLDRQDTVNFVDLCFAYKGMGHITLLTWSPSRKKLFIRNDGGANGYEREDNYNYYFKNYGKPKGFDPDRAEYYDSIEDGLAQL